MPREWQCSYCKQWVSTKYPAHSHSELYQRKPTDIFKKSWVYTVWRETTDAVRQTHDAAAEMKEMG